MGTEFTEFAALVRCLNSGDLIEINRKFYSHWVLYMDYADGAHFCYHVQKTGPISHQPLTDILRILRVPELQLEWNSVARVDNKEREAIKKGLMARKPEEIKPELELKLIREEEQRYHCVTSNCEYFVTLWKFGLGWSTQAIETILSVHCGISSVAYQVDGRITTLLVLLVIHNRRPILIKLRQFYNYARDFVVNLYEMP